MGHRSFPISVECRCTIESSARAGRARIEIVFSELSAFELDLEKSIPETIKMG